MIPPGFRIAINRPTLILLHAFPLNHRMWRYQFSLLKDMGMPYVAYDYPGFGKTPLGEGDYTMERYAEELKGVIKDLNIPKVILCGLSMGGYLALAYTRLFPYDVEGLILANTRATADSPEGKENRFKMMEKVREEGSGQVIVEALWEKMLTWETREKQKDLSQEVQKLMEEASPEGIIQALHAMAHRSDSRDVLKDFTKKVLVIAGEEDTLTTPEDAKRMVALAPKGEIAIIPRAAHLSCLENPHAFNEALKNFLSSF